MVQVKVNLHPIVNNINLPTVLKTARLPSDSRERLFIATQVGEIYYIKNEDVIPFLDISSQIIKLGISDLVESVFSFIQYKAIPVTRLTQNSLTENQLHEEGFINLGWRGWEGCLPTSIIQDCDDSNIDEKIIAYYNEAIKIASWRLNPLTCYFHKDHRPNKFEGTALTGVQPYMGNRIPALKGKVVFTDFARGHVHNSQSLDRGVLAYTNIRSDCNLNDYSIIDVNYDFGSSSAFYVSLGSNMNQTRLYLGVYGSMNVTDTNKGTVFEIVP